MKLIILISAAMFLASSAVAQSGRCSEQNIRRMHSQRAALQESADAYFYSGALDKPIIGAANRKQNAKQVTAARKNAKQYPDVPQKIVASADGSMAYEYGTSRITYDDVSTGKHVDFQTAYLEVLSAEGDACKIVATMAQPIGSGR